MPTIDFMGLRKGKAKCKEENQSQDQGAGLGWRTELTNFIDEETEAQPRAMTSHRLPGKAMVPNPDWTRLHSMSISWHGSEEGLKAPVRS